MSRLINGGYSKPAYIEKYANIAATFTCPRDVEECWLRFNYKRGYQAIEGEKDWTRFDAFLKTEMDKHLEIEKRNAPAVMLALYPDEIA